MLMLQQGVSKVAQLFRPPAHPHQRATLPLFIRGLQVQLHPEGQPEQAHGDPHRQQAVQLSSLQPKLLHEV